MAVDVGLHWDADDLQPAWYHRRLTTFTGDPELVNSASLPIERDEERIVQALQSAPHVVAIQAPTGSGKTMKIPEYLDTVGCSPVLVVLPSVFAAQEAVNSFVFFGWDRHQVHLRTGVDMGEFDQYTTKLSVITYGILWRWLTADAVDDFHPHRAKAFYSRKCPLARYGGLGMKQFSFYSMLINE